METRTRCSAMRWDLSTGPSNVPKTAGSLGVSQRTLYRRCATLRIASPWILISLARVFTVERLAEWSGQPGGAIALALGFSGRSNYRRMVRRTLGAPRPSSANGAARSTLQT